MAWVFLTAIAAAAGIWATHFVAHAGLRSRPAHRLRRRTHHRLAAGRRRRNDGRIRGFRRAAAGRTVAAGGAIIGGGVGLMHFTGMQALSVPGTSAGTWPRCRLDADRHLAAAALLAWHELERRKALGSRPGSHAAICGMMAMPRAAEHPQPARAGSQPALLTLAILRGMHAFTRHAAEGSSQAGSSHVDRRFAQLTCARRMNFSARASSAIS